MPVFFTTATNSKVTVAATTTEVLEADDTRVFARITNDSDEVIYLALGEDAVMNKGIRLNAGGGNFEINATNMFRGTVNAICLSGSKNLCFTEKSKEGD